MEAGPKATALPPPMRVVTVAAPVRSVMRRMRELGAHSARTSPVPVLSAEIASTLKKVACMPTAASLEPEAPVPATVRTTPLAVFTERIRLPSRYPPSARYSSGTPLTSVPATAQPRGDKKLAPRPTPSTLNAAPEPASVTVCAVARLPRVT